MVGDKNNPTLVTNVGAPFVTHSVILRSTVLPFNGYFYDYMPKIAALPISESWC